MKTEWIRRGVVSVGNWEPLAFRLRTWIPPRRSTDIRQRYESEHLEATIEDLRNAGVALIITHFYKGHGLLAEAADIALARDLAARARKHNIRVGAYVQWGTFVPETMVLEEPDCESWARIDSTGATVLPYGSRQSFRWAPCPCNPNFIRYLKHVISECVAALKPDLIHLDNFKESPPPLNCHCPFCQDGFNDFLQRKYPGQAFEEVFGYGSDVRVRLPDLRQSIERIYPQRMYDPAVREWIHFRAAAVAEALGQVVAHAKALDPDVAFDINSEGLHGVNTHLLQAIDSPLLYDKVEAFWNEERAAPRVTATGALVSKFRSYKMTRNFDLMQLSYGAPVDAPPRDRKKWLAESLAFNRNVCLFLKYDCPNPDPGTTEFLRFFAERRDLYTGRKPVSDVAVVRVGASLAPSLSDECGHQMICEQYLFERGSAFEILFDSQTDRLGEFKVILLSGASSLTESFERALADYVRAGGGLVLIGSVGRMNEHLWSHPVNLYKRLADSADTEPEDGCLRLGKGTIVSVDSLAFAAPYPAGEAYDPVTRFYESWLMPTNAGELDMAISRAAAEPLVFAPRFRKGVVLEYYRTDAEYQIHLLDVTDEIGLQGVLAFRPDAGALVEALWTTRRGDRTCRIATTDPGRFEVEIDDETFDTYGVLRLRTELSS